MRGDVELALYEQGAGDAVVLVHGFPELGWSWRHQLPAIAAAGYRAVAFDMRGFGNSSRPEATVAYRLTEMVADLVAVIDVSAATRWWWSVTTGGRSRHGRRR